jgi:hypothetical protein
MAMAVTDGGHRYIVIPARGRVPPRPSGLGSSTWPTGTRVGTWGLSTTLSTRIGRNAFYHKAFHDVTAGNTDASGL